ncbi:MULTISPECIES: Eco57I restriction-modification methylase domain-containing protein [Streptomyces]|uniref:site-specific DNA-methyltransferase (adenine-specific) n=1 Tax=Streptomyces flavovirens TaxID=52258 RepID=A0ABV8NEC9_9ACTN|nr:DNA methyltransferase [Streptomyces sp. MBT51]MBK3593355.1 SAM-dependent DNA methyltransferase [Streptomyces sp. MBT51]
MSRTYLPPTVADLHRSWLELVDTDGPFLAVPALKRAWSTGIHQPDARALAALRDSKPAFEKAWENWDKQSDEPALDLYREARDAWVDTVLRQVLRWGTTYSAAPVGEVRSPNHAITVHADGALVYGETIGALVLVVDPTDSLRDPLTDGWAASPVDRMEELLRATSVPVGVVTDGRWWAIVSARDETMVASGIFDAQTWIEEPQARNAFIELLQRRRLIGGKPEDRLTALFKESVTASEEITEALGTQVRRAVELIVQALSDGALDASRRGEPDPLPARRGDVYEAAVTVMMRVVFLLFAEERGLLPQSQLFAMGYGVSDELDLLDAREHEEGEQALDGTYLTWHRLLATSQALYRGASFEDLRLPEYGGSLFDPARFPFLTACKAQGTLAITVSDRVMLEVLRAVQYARLKGEPARRISFRDIDVEQIGYIYEGLLGYSCEDVDQVFVGLIGASGAEPEIPLFVLESLAETKQNDAALTTAILAWIKENQPAAKPPSKTALAKALGSAETVEDAEQALRAVASDDAELRERLRPFLGVIRRDLRKRPLVVKPGGVLVVETPSRASAGAHYTPRRLAEEVVLHALQPLVYSPGPHQTADQEAWRPISPEQILDLKIADIACGSGAFLVAAARYLADRLVEAWHREGAATGSPHDLRTRAIRMVVASCLYGADINGMAVEMCKLSLWLVSLDPRLPFSFVDDKVLHGNALLGLTDARQLRELHVDPTAADQRISMFALDVDGILGRAARLRRQLATEVNDSDPQRSAATKRRQWRDYQQLTAQLADVADGVIAAGMTLGGKPGKHLKAAYENLRIAVEHAYPAGGDDPNRAMLDGILEVGLTPTVSTDYATWKPLHWILAVPDVMERGGFDAVVGNPPFLGGQKLTGSMGTNVRDWFVNTLASGRKGSADLVAYFLLRAHALLTQRGAFGLIATNTVAQGDTRNVGLDQIVESGFTITRAIQSRSWPAASANLEYAACWGTRGAVAPVVPRVADGIPTQRISTLLEPGGRVDGDPIRLRENDGVAFIGCYVLGMGFVLNSEEAKVWLEADPANAEVVRRYLNGEDLNSRPDGSPARWVIDFDTRSEAEAKEYGLPYQRVLEQVKSERAKNKERHRREDWWQFARTAPAMREAVADLDEVLALARVSKSVMPFRMKASAVPSEQVVIFATDNYADQAVLSSSVHQTWAIKYGSTLETRFRYTPSDAFLTLPRPRPTEDLTEIGRTLDTERREIMLRRGLGLTKLYNLVNDPGIADPSDRDTARLRQIHVELDKAVMDSYNWGDIPLDHGFHTYRQMQRWTFSPDARVEILDRLLEESQRRAALQVGVPLPTDTDDEEESDE